VLALGAITDPGTDTVQSYVIDWGDGSTQTVTTAGDVSHTYASAGARNIAVTVVDEDGSHANAATLAVSVGAATPQVSIEAGGNETLAEGQSLSRSIVISDGQDNGSPGWSYSIDYGDGSALQTGTTLTPALALDHVYADGAANRTVTVTVTDVNGETASDSFSVAVTNVAPTAAVSGAAAVNEGASYTLTVGAVTDPGADTRTGYRIDWGDGVVQNLTPAQWAAAAGSFNHVYADG
ncbi:PKD domain-containing protein, partial [Aquincola tertiaricarbonis]|uniref:PKD domain-containing protein n=1 Tax=Aquincola tertiaricarbonis TaxID=391953 RepID=UPI0006150EF6